MHKMTTIWPLLRHHLRGNTMGSVDWLLHCPYLSLGSTIVRACPHSKHLQAKQKLMQLRKKRPRDSLWSHNKNNSDTKTACVQVHELNGKTQIRKKANQSYITENTITDCMAVLHCINGDCHYK